MSFIEILLTFYLRSLADLAGDAGHTINRRSP